MENQTENPAPIRLHHRILDGKPIAYTDQTEFLVQVGKGPKGRYSTKYCLSGDERSLLRAVGHYIGINIGNGYKKRILMRSSPRKVLARQTSQ